MSNPPGALQGIRIVDTTAMVSGPLATMVLADQGADVIKVEPPGSGDLIRRIGASRGGLSGLFHAINRNKRSIVVNLREARGREILEQLVSSADVFVQNFRPGVLERLGLGESALRKIAPDLIYVSVSAWGESGPYAGRPAFDSILQAMAGYAASQASPDSGEPVLLQNIVCDKASALYVAQAITAALLARERGAGGQHVRLAMLDAAVAFLWPDVMQAGTFLGDGASASANHGGLSVRPTKDGFVAIACITDAQFQATCRALGLDELARDARFTSVEERMRNLELLGELLSEHTRGFHTRELCERLVAEDVPHAPVNELASIHEDPQVIANALLLEVEHERSGSLRIPRHVTRFEGTPASIRCLAPTLGEHTDEILAELGMGTETEGLRAGGVVE